MEFRDGEKAGIGAEAQLRKNVCARGDPSWSRTNRDLSRKSLDGREQGPQSLQVVLSNTCRFSTAQIISS